MGLKKLHQKVSQTCASSQYFLHNYKVSRNTVEWFQELRWPPQKTTQNKTGLTNRRFKNITPITTHCIEYKKLWHLSWDNVLTGKRSRSLYLASSNSSNIAGRFNAEILPIWRKTLSNQSIKQLRIKYSCILNSGVGFIKICGMYIIV